MTNAIVSLWTNTVSWQRQQKSQVGGMEKEMQQMRKASDPCINNDELVPATSVTPTTFSCSHQHQHQHRHKHNEAASYRSDTHSPATCLPPPSIPQHDRIPPLKNSSFARSISNLSALPGVLGVGSVVTDLALSILVGDEVPLVNPHISPSNNHACSSCKDGDLTGDDLIGLTEKSAGGNVKLRGGWLDFHTSRCSMLGPVSLSIHPLVLSAEACVGMFWTWLHSSSSSPSSTGSSAGRIAFSL